MSAAAGVCVVTARMTAYTVSPVNGRSPVTAWYSTTPRLNRSARLSTGLPTACSGAM